MGCGSSVPAGNVAYKTSASGVDQRMRVKELEALLQLERTGLAGSNSSQKLPPPFDVVALAVAPPGAGLTTQAKVMAKSRPDIVVLEVGALFAAEVARDSPTGAAVKALLSVGAAVPDTLVVAIVATALQRAAAEDVEGKKVAACVFGFPRTVQQSTMLEEQGIVPSIVISLECPEAVAAKRMASGPPRMAPRSQQQLAGTAAALSRYSAQGRVFHVNATGTVDEVAEAMKVPLREMDRVLGLKAKFRAADVDGSGEVDVAELTAALKTSGLTFDRADVERLVAQYDEDGSGHLNESEFIELVQRELALVEELRHYREAFEKVDVDKSGEIDATEFGALMSRMGHPMSAEEVKATCARFDADGSGTISFPEFLEIVKAGLVDLGEVRAALFAADALSEREAEYNIPSQATADPPNPPSFLYDHICKLIEDNKPDLENMSGVDDEETDATRGVLVKLVQDVVLWEPEPGRSDALERFPAETRGRDLLKEITNKRGWDWKNAEGAKDSSLDGMGAWYRSMLVTHSAAGPAELMVAVVSANKTTVDAMSAKYGPLFDECIINIIAGLVCWDSNLIDEDGILALDEPAIFAFSFGTGDKIGPALDMKTKVGPGCETPGKTNEGLAEEIKAILKVRPMPVFAQWEIADALLHGPRGHPHPESFYRWEFGDACPGGDSSKVGEWYGRVEEFAVEGGGENGEQGTKSVNVHKSLPIWPMAIKEKLVDEEALADGATMKRFYLSTVGVLQQNQEYWSKGGIATRPKSTIVVGQLDHVKRCQKLVRDLMLPRADGDGNTTLDLGPSEIPAYRFYPKDWSSFACDKFGYDPVSTQKWTRNRPLFIAHEATARGMQYVREDFGPLPIHQALERRRAKGAKNAGAKLASKDAKLAALLGPKSEWD